MKALKTSILILAIILSAAMAWGAGPYVVCDPYPNTTTQPTDFGVIVDGGAEIISPAQTLGDASRRLYFDIAGITSGSHTMSVKALVIDSTWGRLESSATPFSFSKPASPGATVNIKLEK